MRIYYDHKRQKNVRVLGYYAENNIIEIYLQVIKGNERYKVTLSQFLSPNFREVL